MPRSKWICMCLCLFLLCMTMSYAQFEEQVDQLLEQETAHFGTTVYLVLVAAEHCEDTESVSRAMEILKDKKWEIPVKGEDEVITLGEYAFLLMKAFQIPGGIMYMVLPGPRYATRELAYLKLITQRPVPGRTVSGEEVMTILTRVMEWKEGE
jgi:hypothetical protein